MHTVEQGDNYLSCEHLQSTTALVLPVITLISFSVLGFIFIHRYIGDRRRQAYISEIKQTDQDFWLQSSIMEKGDIISTDSQYPSACDILQPLSHTSLLPSSGTLAAQVREQQNERAAIDASSPTSSKASSLEAAEEVQKRNESVQRMCDEDAEGGRTWKRVVVEYS